MDYGKSDDAEGSEDMTNNLRSRIIAWVYARDLRTAKRKFEKVRKSSIYNKAPQREKRALIKEIIRAAGFKKIRIKEK